MSNKRDISDQISDHAAELFFGSVRQRELQSARQSHANKKILDEKNETLIPVRKLLKRLTDAGVYVGHNALYEPSAITRPQAPQLFSVWEEPSSPRWSPGFSIFFDHPAVVEIAVSNPNTKDQDGVVMISCATPHPHAYLLQGPFPTVEAACVALAQFLSHSTVRVDRPEQPFGGI